MLHCPLKTFFLPKYWSILAQLQQVIAEVAGWQIEADGRKVLTVHLPPTSLVTSWMETVYQGVCHCNVEDNLQHMTDNSPVQLPQSTSHRWYDYFAINSTFKSWSASCIGWEVTDSFLTRWNTVPRGLIRKPILRNFWLLASQNCYTKLLLEDNSTFGNHFYIFSHNWTRALQSSLSWSHRTTIDLYSGHNIWWLSIFVVCSLILVSMEVLAVDSIFHEE